MRGSLAQSETSLGALLRLGFGAITPITSIEWSLPTTGPQGLILNVLVANAAQPILSILYFCYNGLFTSIFTSYEWESFSGQRKGLRVSASPVGSQRSTYFLQLPYRIALPLMVTSGLLHWLVSQSIFLVNIRTPGFGNTNSPAYYLQSPENLDASVVVDKLTCGYSPIAIFCVIILGVLMIILILGIGCRRFKSGMPVASSCSWAIAAACHTYPGTNGTRDDAKHCVGWGIMGIKDDGVPYCGFSKEETYPVVYGVLYS